MLKVDIHRVVGRYLVDSHAAAPFDAMALLAVDVSSLWDAMVSCSGLIWLSPGCYGIVLWLEVDSLWVAMMTAGNWNENM
uniref:Uncharacterized protein n=1 Tax=Timema bartmani TaxID=61472 RepID=A0A7R9I5N9_9NEOP|nr:unnamed protein product [Timema bartmani]